MADNQFLARREFLTEAVALAPAGLFVLAESAPAARRPRSTRSATLDIATVKSTEFAKHQGTPFAVSAGERTVTLKLVEIQQLRIRNDKDRPKDVRREPFSLLFVATNFNELDSAIYKFQHDKLGAFEAFLSEVRVGEESAMRHYEVIFN